MGPARHARLFVTRLLGGAAVSLALAASPLGGCAGAGCPTPVPVASLPDSIRARLDLSPPPEVRVSRARQRNPNSDLIVRLAEHDTFRPGLRTEDRPVVLPMTSRGEHWTVPLTVVAINGQARVVNFKIDTGSHTQLSMDSRSANRLGVVVPAEITEGISHTAFGPKRVHTGVIAELRAPGAMLFAVEVAIDCSGRSYSPRIGIRLLERFGHAIFDWDARTLTLLPRGWTSRTADATGREGWAALPWTADPVSLRRDSIEHEGDGRRRVLVEMASRWVRVSLDGTDRVTLLDTGFSGDVFAFEPMGVESRRKGTVVGQGFGRRDTFRTDELENPVRLVGAGPHLELDGLTLIGPTTDYGNMTLVERAGFEIMLGLGVLQRYPMWLDFERDEARFWTGVGPIPMPVPMPSDAPD
ncbi:MAG: putative aspartyl protease [Phycisphaerales bacterium]|jgi:predicted aspartyl protease